MIRRGKDCLLALLRPISQPTTLKKLGETFFKCASLRRNPPPNNADAKAIAIVKLDRLGDLILLSGALADYRAHWPNARIHLIVRESLAPLARLCPHVDEVIGFPVVENTLLYNSGTRLYRSWWKELSKQIGWCRRNRIWNRRIQIVLIPRWDVDRYGAVMLAYLTGARERWGISESVSELKQELNRSFDVLLTRAQNTPGNQHEVVLNQSFAEYAGCSNAKPRLLNWSTPKALQAAQELMAQFTGSQQRVNIAVCMGAGAMEKMWPVKKYAQLCLKVFNPSAVRLITFGTADEAPLGVELKQLAGESVINMEGKTPIELLPVCLAQCSLYLGSNTGTMHAAAAVNIPILEISSHPLEGDSTYCEAPERFGAWGKLVSVAQPKRASTSISELTAEEVEIELRELLRNANLDSQVSAPNGDPEITN